MLRSIGSVFVVTLCLAACTEEEPEPVDTGPDFDGVVSCTWLSDNNCWRDMVPALAACRSSIDDDFGWFDSTRTTCTYDDGVTAHFNQSIPADGDLDQIVDFGLEMTSATGESCLAWSQWALDYEYGYTMQQGDSVFEAYGYGSTGWFRCPDNTLWEIEDAWALWDCGDLIEITPGVAVYSQDSKFGVNLIGLAKDYEVLAQCDDPEAR
jgi:hypothetical protein